MKIRSLVFLLGSALFPALLCGSPQYETAEKKATVYPETEIRVRTEREAETLLLKARRIEEIDPEFAEILTRQVRLYALQSNNPKLRVRAQLQIATLLMNSTRYPEALKVALQVKELAEDLDAEYELGCCYEILGKIQIAKGDYAESLQNLFLALNYFDKLQDAVGRGSVLNSIGVVYFRQQDLDKAMNYYTRAAAIAVIAKDSMLIGRVLNNMGGVYFKRGNVRQALIKFRESMKIQESSGLYLKLGIIQMNLAILYRQTGQFREAFEYFSYAMALFEKFDNFHHQALCCINLSIYYETTGDDVNWLGCLRKASSIGEKYGLKGVQYEADDGLRDYFEKHKVYDSAYYYAVRTADIKQLIDNEISASNLSVAEIQYKFDKNNAEQTIKQQRQNMIMLIVVMTLVSMILITVLIITRQRQKAKVNSLEKKNLTDELEFKNRELALQVMNLLKRNEFIIDTSHRMMDISIDKQPEEIREEVVKIAKSLQDQTDKEIWEEFELRFKQVHSGFYERLLHRFPELTPNELKMCGLLRLNLTTKEISELTGQRREAIEMARFRLRKHLGLNDPQINLITFLGKV